MQSLPTSSPKERETARHRPPLAAGVLLLIVIARRERGGGREGRETTRHCCTPLPAGEAAWQRGLRQRGEGVLALRSLLPASFSSFRGPHPGFPSCRPLHPPLHHDSPSPMAAFQALLRRRGAAEAAVQDTPGAARGGRGGGARFGQLGLGAPRYEQGPGELVVGGGGYGGGLGEEGESDYEQDRWAAGQPLNGSAAFAGSARIQPCQPGLLTPHHPPLCPSQLACGRVRTGQRERADPQGCLRGVRARRRPAAVLRGLPGCLPPALRAAQRRSLW